MTSESDTEAASQLQQELENSVQNTTFDAGSSRPICMHLNADSSWLLSFPCSANARPGRCRFNLVIDCWFTGPQVDIHPWFSSQTHAQPSRIQSFEQLNNMLIDAEVSVVKGVLAGTKQLNPYYIDAVVCSHEFTDHCHEATLRQLPSTVPVYAPRKAASLIRSWRHFQHIREIPIYNPGYDWRADSRELLPSWLSLGRIQTQPPIYFHSALVITFQLEYSDEVEGIIYTPHGVTADRLALVKQGNTPVKVLALLHGLHDVSLAGATLNMGLQNAMKAQQVLDARYWFPTHDEVKEAHGLVAGWLKRVAHTLPVAPGSHPTTEMTEDKVDKYKQAGRFYNWRMVGNGECVVLA